MDSVMPELVSEVEGGRPFHDAKAAVAGNILFVSM